MKAFLRTKVGIACVAAFILGMAGMFHHVLSRANPPPAGSRANARTASNAQRADAPRIPSPIGSTAASSPPIGVGEGADDDRANPDPARSVVAENAAYLEQYFQNDRRIREDYDRQGNLVTRRTNANTPNEAGVTTIDEAALASSVSARSSLRLLGRRNAPGSILDTAAAIETPPSPPPDRTAPPAPTEAEISAAGKTTSAPADLRRNWRNSTPRFNPYGRVIKCELVFTIDSTNEESPLIGLVMEPVYNNGQLVIPAGAEFHGVARPDRLRDRLFSGENWILVLPRERSRPNGRQLAVRGVALDRIEPAGTGLTWGITDGSYGLEGRIIRTMQDEEIKRFAATFFAQGALTLQDRHSNRDGGENVLSTPENAVLQGLSANLEKVAADISEEIAKHGVFIRVPAGHQFYFYPKQRIEPDAADRSLDPLP